MFRFKDEPDDCWGYWLQVSWLALVMVLTLFFTATCFSASVAYGVTALMDGIL